MIGSVSPSPRMLRVASIPFMTGMLPSMNTRSYLEGTPAAEGDDAVGSTPKFGDPLDASGAPACDWKSNRVGESPLGERPIRTSSAEAAAPLGERRLCGVLPAGPFAPMPAAA